jgi:hypothetical protein
MRTEELDKLKKMYSPHLETDNTALGIRRADQATPSIRKSLH